MANTTDHEHKWVDDGALEVAPPIALSHCKICGLKRRVTAAGKVTYYPKTTAGDGTGNRSTGNGK